MWKIEVRRRGVKKKRKREKPENLDTGESGVQRTGEPGQADRSWASVRGGGGISAVLQLPGAGLRP